MKKYLSIALLSVVLLIGTTAISAENITPQKNNPPHEQHQKIRQGFEKRLNLTEEQKEKAKKIHKKGAEQMKKIMQEKDALRKELHSVYKSDQDDKTKSDKIKKLKDKIKKLDKKAHEIRKANGKEFEKILNEEQKKELEKMKSEGRAKFEKRHRPKPPFSMFPPEWDNHRGKKPMYPPPKPIQEPNIDK